jgi:hypothetical protein
MDRWLCDRAACSAPGAATSKPAVLLALLTPCTWAVEFGLMVIWFGVEALGGPMVR